MYYVVNQRAIHDKDKWSNLCYRDENVADWILEEVKQRIVLGLFPQVFFDHLATDSSVSKCHDADPSGQSGLSRANDDDKITSQKWLTLQRVNIFF